LRGTPNLEHTARYHYLALVMSGVFLSTMDSGMVNVALPNAMRDLSVELPWVELIVTVYLITITVTLVLWGQLADRIGRCNVYLSGMAGFSCASLCCYFSPTLNILLCFRFLQALGAAMMMASGPAIIKTVFPADKLGRSLGLIGIATAAGLLTGPYVCGILLTVFPWKTIFIVTLPVSFTGLTVGLLYLRRNFPNEREAVWDSFDWRGSCFWIMTTVTGMWWLHSLHGGIDGLWIVLGGVTALFGAIFLKFETRASQPILPLHLLRRPYFCIAVVTAAFSFAGLFSVLVLLPFYLDLICGLSSPQIGRMMMAVPATLILLSPLSGFLHDKIGARPLTVTGLFLSGCGLFGLAVVLPGKAQGAIGLMLALIGAGQSIFLSPNSASVLSRVGAHYTGVSAGILATARNFGMVFGTTFSILVFSYWYGHSPDGSVQQMFDPERTGDFIVALRGTLMLTALMPFTGAALSIFREGKEL